MNAIVIFAIATIVNVTLSTIRAICTIKGGKWISATTNAICYGFYPLIVMLTAKGTVDILINMGITAIANFCCVWIIKFVEEKVGNIGGYQGVSQNLQNLFLRCLRRFAGQPPAKEYSAEN